MSDHFYNYLSMTGCNRKIRQVKKYLKTKKEDGTLIEFDMGKIIPIPNDMLKKMNGRRSILESLFQPREKDDLNIDEMKFKEMTYDQKLSELNFAIDILKCKHEFGYTSYSEWCYKNRGFKNVSDGKIIPGSDTIEFITTNGNGTKIVRELSRLFPDVIFTLKFDLDVISSCYGLLKIIDSTTLKYGHFSYLEDAMEVDFTF